MPVDNETSGRIVWVDCEMTGLDLRTDALIEIAAIVTDSDLNPLGEGIDVVIRPPSGALDAMISLVRDMHSNSGLLAELPHGVSIAEAEARVLDYVRAWVPVAGKAPLAGNSVSTDRQFIDRDMPTFGSFLHYRTIDVSSIKELSRRWFPRIYFHAPEKDGNHRALGDILDSIDELRYYRAALFVPEPGPDSDTVKAISARIAATSVNDALEASEAEQTRGL
ncbi:MAG: oligoribonuclease [Bifidobacteriaceae bacterium]|jgi:oligoribonuclease|nr:oligoribonuclease [Bifidobacteriaceae bacterium]